MAKTKKRLDSSKKNANNYSIVEDDNVWVKLAEARYRQKSKYINHNEAWGS